MTPRNSAVGQVSKIYEEGLHVPANKSEAPFIICPVGYIGSGKSTVLKLLQQQLPFVRISTDELRKLLREHNNFDSNHAREISLALISKYSQAGYNVGIDATCWRLASGGDYERDFHDLIQKSGARVFWIDIDPPEEFIINKLRAYQHTWLFRNGDHAVERYRVHKEAVKKDGIPFLYTFDPSRGNLSEQVDEAVELIRRGLR
jgi:predicted kinase